MTTRVSNGARLQAVNMLSVDSTLPLKPQLTVFVEIRFALDAADHNIDPQIAKWLISGTLKIIVKAKMYNGS